MKRHDQPFLAIPAATLLAEFDAQVRGTLEQRFPSEWHGTRRRGVLLVRIPHRGMVFTDGLHDLAAPELDRTIAEAIDFFAERHEQFEWKTYSHDHPELEELLKKHGLRADPVESVMIGPVEALSGAGEPPREVSLRRVHTRPELERVAAMESEVWQEDWSSIADDLGDRVTSTPDDIQIWVAEHDGLVVSAAWLVRMPGTEFAGLWGGSTLEQWRKRGIYRALVAVRAQAATGMGIRYLTVDASDQSRPILERLGMRAVATTTPWIWQG